MDMSNRNEELIDGLAAARYYKYFAQDINPNIINKLPFQKIRAKSLYDRNKKLFDILASSFCKFNIDIVQYLKFIVKDCGKTERDAGSVLLDPNLFYRYIDELKVKAQYRRIYKHFLKSANNIADGCIQQGFASTKDYLRYLISSQQLATKYVAGEISVYYLCAIHNFKKIVPKLDKLSQSEFSIILDRYDKYSSDVQEAFKLCKSCKINPIKFTDELIWKKTNKSNSK